MKAPYTINLQEGQSVLIYNNNKVLIKKTSVECRSVFTAWDSFVGTADEVEAEIKRLGLIEVKSPKITVPVAPVSRPAAKPAQTATPAPEAVPTGNIVTNTVSTVTNAVTNAVSSTWNTITSIFTNNNNQ